MLISSSLNFEMLVLFEPVALFKAVIAANIISAYSGSDSSLFLGGLPLPLLGGASGFCDISGYSGSNRGSSSVPIAIKKRDETNTVEEEGEREDSCIGQSGSCSFYFLQLNCTLESHPVELFWRKNNSLSFLNHLRYLPAIVNT